MERLPFVDGPVAPCFRRWSVTIEPGATLEYRSSEWSDALVVIERGAVELESESGVRCMFSSGDVVWLVGLPLRALHNPTTDPVILVAVSRRAPDP